MAGPAPTEGDRRDVQAQLGMQERPEIHLPPPVFGEETAKNKLVIPKGLPRSSWVLKKNGIFLYF